MPRIPMPSPNGTNYERLLIPADPVMAYDSATFHGFAIDDPRPITRERIRARAVPRHPENRTVPRFAYDADNAENADTEKDDAIELPEDVLAFLKARLNTDDMAQLFKLLSGEAKLVRDDEDDGNNIAMDRAARARDLAYGPPGLLKRFPHAHRLR